MVIEDVYVAFPKVAIILARFGGVAIETAYRATKAVPVLMPVTVVRKILRAGQKKHQVFDFIVKHFGFTDWEYKTHNDQADAIALGLAYTLKNKRE